MNDQVVTKVKSEGRVAAGKRLVEWNRKQKENLLKNKEQVESSGDSSVLSRDAGDQKENLLKNKEQVESSGDSSVLSRDAGDQQEPQSRASTVVCGGGAIAMLVLAGGALYFYTRRATPATLSTPVNPSALDNDIFRMH